MEYQNMLRSKIYHFLIIIFFFQKYHIIFIKKNTGIRVKKVLIIFQNGLKLDARHLKSLKLFFNKGVAFFEILN